MKHTRLSPLKHVFSVCRGFSRADGKGGQEHRFYHLARVGAPSQCHARVAWKMSQRQAGAPCAYKKAAAGAEGRQRGRPWRKRLMCGVSRGHCCWPGWRPPKLRRAPAAPAWFSTGSRWRPRGLPAAFPGTTPSGGLPLSGPSCSVSLPRFSIGTARENGTFLKRIRTCCPRAEMVAS